MIRNRLVVVFTIFIAVSFMLINLKAESDEEICSKIVSSDEEVKNSESGCEVKLKKDVRKSINSEYKRDYTALLEIYGQMNTNGQYSWQTARKATIKDLAAKYKLSVEQIELILLEAWCKLK
jgi:hypothetical protein